jgi:hypothetical protein
MDARQISRVMKKMESRYTLTKEKPPGRTRTVVVDKTIERVKHLLELSPRRSVSTLRTVYAVQGFDFISLDNLTEEVKELSQQDST